VTLKEALDQLPPDVRAAALTAAATLTRLGIPYAFVGGIAVGAHGHIRQTVDVDFLVGEEAFEQVGQIVTFKQGVPISVGRVRVDYLSASSFGPAVQNELRAPIVVDGFPVVSLGVLVLTKLVAGRRKDQADIVELVKVGADTRLVGRWLKAHAPDRIPQWEALVEDAERERS
jgi:hypothetical protein